MMPIYIRSIFRTTVLEACYALDKTAAGLKGDCICRKGDAISDRRTCVKGKSLDHEVRVKGSHHWVMGSS